MMTDLENFRATLAHERPGRILYAAGFVGDLHERVVQHIGADDIAGHYGMYAPVGLHPRRPEGLLPIDYSRYWENEELPEGTTLDGVGVAMVPSGYFHFWGYVSPLRNATDISEIENYPLDDLTQFDFSHLPGVVEDAHANGRVAVGWIGHMYETAWQIRGLEEFFVDVLERPAWAECLLQRLADQNMILAKACAEAGADVLHCGDDVATQNASMFAPDLWRKLMHSRWAKVWRAAKEIKPDIKIWYHSDGNVIELVDDLVDAGLDILNPLQPECLDIDAIHQRFGPRLTFDGTIGTQSTMPFGTPDEVRERVRTVIAKYGQKGGLMIAPTHVLEPEVPLENIDALFEACREYGTFE